MKKSPPLKASSLQLSILECYSPTSYIKRSGSRTNQTDFGFAGWEIQQTGQPRIRLLLGKAKQWRYRWLALQPTLDTVETTTDPKKARWELQKAIRVGLSDAERSGSPGKFSAHDYCQILDGRPLPCGSGRTQPAWATCQPMGIERINR